MLFIASSVRHLCSGLSICTNVLMPLIVLRSGACALMSECYHHGFAFWCLALHSSEEIELNEGLNERG